MWNPACKLCQSPLEKMLDFGTQPLANDLIGPYNEERLWYKAWWGWCAQCQVLQLMDVPPFEEVYTADYPYKSGTSKVMDEHFRQTANLFMDMFLGPESAVLELACNDGGVLQFLPSGMTRLGYEPASACWPDLERKGVPYRRKAFDRHEADILSRAHANFDLVYIANTLRSLEDLGMIFDGVVKVMAPAGRFIIDDPYLVDILASGEFDQFYSENVWGFTITAMQNIAARWHLEVIGVLKLPHHGGSMRYVLGWAGVHPIAPEVEAFKRDLDEANVYLALKGFQLRANDIAAGFNEFLRACVDRGLKVCGYGATAKSVTMLNFAGIDTTLLPYTYDTTPAKKGKLLPGVRIPILDADLFANDKSDVVVMFPYNHKKEIMAREKGRLWLLYAPFVHTERSE